MVFFDVADTLLIKKGIHKVYNQALGANFEELKILQSIRSVFDRFQVPDHPDVKFYIDFNRQVTESLGIDQASDEKLILISNEIKKLSWTCFSLEEKNFIKSIDNDICIISNWGSSLREQLSEKFERNFFKYIISSEVKCQKPNLDIYHIAYEYKTSDHPIYVGDSIKLDIIPAEKVGFRAILIDRFDYYPNFMGEKIKSLTELSNII